MLKKFVQNSTRSYQFSVHRGCILSAVVSLHTLEYLICNGLNFYSVLHIQFLAAGRLQRRSPGSQNWFSPPPSSYHLLPKACLFHFYSISVTQHIAWHQHCLALAQLDISIAWHQHCLVLALLSISIAQHQIARTYCLAFALLSVSFFQRF